MIVYRPLYRCLCPHRPLNSLVRMSGATSPTSCPPLAAKLSTMTTSTSHTERTAHEPRDKDLNEVVVSGIEEINQTIRILRLAIPSGQSIRFLPGQWVDLYVPGISRAGGFTITSTPADASAKPASSQLTSPNDSSQGYLELAIQKSPQNPPAAWLWQSSSVILGKSVQVRVGGSFTWPPADIDVSKVGQIIFVAGGVGINPLISILGHLAQSEMKNLQVKFFYSVKAPEVFTKSSILFLERLVKLSNELDGNLSLHLTGRIDQSRQYLDGIPFTAGRITEEHLLQALGPVVSRKNTLCYVCGVPAMTDELVEALKGAEGMDPQKVLCEKWW